MLEEQPSAADLDLIAEFEPRFEMLDANSLGHEVEARIRQGWDAASSLKYVVEQYIQQFKNMADPYMQERAVDMEDLSNALFFDQVNLV